MKTQRRYTLQLLFTPSLLLRSDMLLPVFLDPRVPIGLLTWKLDSRSNGAGPCGEGSFADGNFWSWWTSLHLACVLCSHLPIQLFADLAVCWILLALFTSVAFVDDRRSCYRDGAPFHSFRPPLPGNENHTHTRTQNIDKENSSGVESKNEPERLILGELCWTGRIVLYPSHGYWTMARH